jgi:hypothetical protein
LHRDFDFAKEKCAFGKSARFLCKVSESAFVMSLDRMAIILQRGSAMRHELRLYWRWYALVLGILLTVSGTSIAGDDLTKEEKEEARQLKNIKNQLHPQGDRDTTWYVLMFREQIVSGNTLTIKVQFFKVQGQDVAAQAVLVYLKGPREGVRDYDYRSFRGTEKGEKAADECVLSPWFTCLRSSARNGIRSGSPAMQPASRCAKADSRVVGSPSAAGWRQCLSLLGQNGFF